MFLSKTVPGIATFSAPADDALTTLKQSKTEESGTAIGHTELKALQLGTTSGLQLLRAQTLGFTGS